MPLSSYHDALPLDIDVRWVSINKIAERLNERLRSSSVVAHDLREALASGLLRCKIQSGHTGERELLPPQVWAGLKLIWWETDRYVEPVCRESKRPYRRGWFFYVWLPDFEALWPDGPEPPPPPQETTSQGRKTRREAELEALRRVMTEAALWVAPRLRRAPKVDDLMDACLKEFPNLAASTYRKRVGPIARILIGLPAQAKRGAKP